MLTPLFGISALPEPYPRVPSCFQRLFICRIPLQAYRAPVSPSFPASFRARRLWIRDQSTVVSLIGGYLAGIEDPPPTSCNSMSPCAGCANVRPPCFSMTGVLRSMSPILIITDCVYCMSNRLCILYVQQTVYTVWPRRSDPF